MNPTPADSVSVIVPCYNQGEYLVEAIECVLAQSHPHVELIVVNDGSTDDTAAVAARYASRVRYLEQANAGSSAARNAGLQVATGRYVLFLDADDRLHADSLAWLVEAAAGRDDRLAIQGYEEFGAEGTEVQPPRPMQPKDVEVGTWVQYNPCPIHSILCPRQAALDHGGFDRRLHYCEDWDFWLKLLLAGIQPVLTPHVGAFYRMHAGTKSTHYAAMFACRVQLLLRTYDFVAPRSELLATLGMNLLQAAHRTVRRYYAMGVRDAWWPHVLAMVHDLNRRGFHARWSLVRRVLDPLAGYRAEHIAALYDYYFRPQRFLRLVRSIG